MSQPSQERFSQFLKSRFFQTGLTLVVLSILVLVIQLVLSKNAEQSKAEALFSAATKDMTGGRWHDAIRSFDELLLLHPGVDLKAKAEDGRRQSILMASLESYGMKDCKADRIKRYLTEHPESEEKERALGEWIASLLNELQVTYDSTDYTVIGHRAAHLNQIHEILNGKEAEDSSKQENTDFPDGAFLNAARKYAAGKSDAAKKFAYDCQYFYNCLVGPEVTELERNTMQRILCDVSNTQKGLNELLPGAALPLNDAKDLGVFWCRQDCSFYESTFDGFQRHYLKFPSAKNLWGVRYVVRVKLETVELERCGPYVPEGSLGSLQQAWISRNKIHWDIKVQDAGTGKLIGEHRFSGPPPRSCKEIEEFSDSGWPIYGLTLHKELLDQPSASEAWKWITELTTKR